LMSSDAVEAEDPTAPRRPEQRPTPKDIEFHNEP
jgi:hypothetical protein